MTIRPVAAESLSEMKVRTGSVVLRESGFDALRNRSVGFIGNHTSLLPGGKSTVQALIESGVCTVAKLFAPEHGAFGNYDEELPDEADPTTGLHIYSLYGSHKKPTPEMLDGLDLLIVELQDVGARFYTYIATLLLAIEAAADVGILVLVLDRPNPIGGLLSDGPIADSLPYSFVAPYSLPIQTGLTFGETGKLYAIETGRDKAFSCLTMDGWQRSEYFEQTGVEWVCPSPAMRSIDTAFVYPGVCLLEQTNISVGRGTEQPFQTIGAPFIDKELLLKSVNRKSPPGVSAEAISFTPTSSKYAGQACHGIKITVSDRRSFRPVEFGITLLAELRDNFSNAFDLAGCQGLLANADTFDRLVSGQSSQQIIDSWQKPLENWHNRCSSCYLY